MTGETDRTCDACTCGLGFPLPLTIAFQPIVRPSSGAIEAHEALGTELEFVIMVIAVSCVKLLSAHNSTQHTSRKHKV
jgi:hypothetical protein